VLWLDDRLVVFQTKERDAASDGSLAGLEKWFKGAIVKEATRQIRDTHDYLREYDTIVVTNARGHRFDVNTKKLDPVVNVILYGSEKGFPEDFSARKHHVSRTTGLFMHILEFTDYVSVCAVLETPIEVVDYLQFRERYLSEVEGAAARTEKWLLGRFLMSPDIPDGPPNRRRIGPVANRRLHNGASWIGRSLPPQHIRNTQKHRSSRNPRSRTRRLESRVERRKSYARRIQHTRANPPVG